MIFHCGTVWTKLTLSYADIFAKDLTHLLKCELTCTLISLIGKAITRWGDKIL